HETATDPNSVMLALVASIHAFLFSRKRPSLVRAKAWILATSARMTIMGAGSRPLPPSSLRAAHRVTAVAAVIAEEAEELGVGRQHHGGVAIAERFAIGFHRAVEGEELRVLAEGVGIDLDRGRVAFAAGALRLVGGFGERHALFAVGARLDLERLLLALGAVL